MFILLSNMIVLFISAYNALLFLNIEIFIKVFYSSNKTIDSSYKPIIFRIEYSIMPYPNTRIYLFGYKDDDKTRHY